MQPLCQVRAAASLLAGVCATVFLFGQKDMQSAHSAGSGPTTRANVSLTPPAVRYVDIAEQAGLDALIVAGSEERKKYIIETTGSGVALFDYDNDGRLDVFLVDGSRLDASAGVELPTNRLYRNEGMGKFKDVTEKAGLARSGWGQRVCADDYVSGRTRHQLVCGGPSDYSRDGLGLKIYGVLEAAIGLYALATPSLIRVSSPVLANFYPQSPSILAFMRGVLCAVILLPATMLMGATLPVLAGWLASRGAVSRFYALNVVGAGTGALLTGFALLPGFGYSRTLLLASFTNVAIGAMAFGAGRNRGPVEPTQSGAVAVAVSEAPPGFSLWRHSSAAGRNACRAGCASCNWRPLYCSSTRRYAWEHRPAGLRIRSGPTAATRCAWSGPK